MAVRHCIEEKHGRDSTGYLREDCGPLYTQKVGGPSPSPPNRKLYVVLSKRESSCSHRPQASR
jgi:hypothetical protein